MGGWHYKWTHVEIYENVKRAAEERRGSLKNRSRQTSCRRWLMNELLKYNKVIIDKFVSIDINKWSEG